MEPTKSVENNVVNGFFDVRVDVSGLSPPTSIVYVVSPVRRNDMQVMGTQSTKREVSRSSLSILHGDPIKHAFRTGLPGGEWADGAYAIDAAVLDVEQPAFDVRRSDVFRVE